MIEIKDIAYWYENKDNPLFENVNLVFEKGKSYAIVGRSGSGKTTFLSLIAGLDKPKSGEILYEGEAINKIGLTRYRNKDVSIVFQSYNLFSYMSALENLMTAMAITGASHAGDRDYAIEMLKKVGIDEEMAKKNVQHLSGGQQQRVAVVRTMCCDARLVVADEPTGNLDEANTKEIIELLQDLAKSQGKCVIIVTHEPDVAQMCDVQYVLKDRQFQIMN
ncbi:ABC transporter ATP-binding protein [Dellaglioa carnosa]|uniref:ABC transporter ATP-binding protein n=1 Tax=Dellaglioa carnosa TaxID=2995136 RepID=A0ABT4JM24_9LACO|nr:ABC transporter ATP-binding protein [Dellaglioa carnosa]MCZ2491409.1 ABC transporter ATP-binding protein [Dellaglioa carnosa]MCZ2494487.1 ABC transporter ATP-binding protein [Dellaglioa carnosa]MDK1731097.1 ABC transporter ATP-binding protein [Dellaglioa carnosa]